MQKRLRVGLYTLAFTLLLASVLTIRVAEFAVHEYAGFAALPTVLQQVLLWLDNARLFMTPLIVKWTLEPVRILTAVVWSAALYVWMRQREPWLHAKTRGVLKLFGERSLVVYVMHAITIFALLLLIPGNHGFVANTLLSVGVLALVYGGVVAHARVSTYSRRRAAMAATKLRLTSKEPA